MSNIFSKTIRKIKEEQPHELNIFTVDQHFTALNQVPLPNIPDTLQLNDINDLLRFF